MPKIVEPTVDAVDPSPKVRAEKEEMVTIFVDPEMVTMQGIRINGKKYIGKVTVPKDQADDILRIQEEYWETRKKLMDKNVSIRMKSDFQKEALFLADPRDNEGKKSFSRDYGLLGAREWSLCSEQFKKYLLEQRKNHFGY